MEKNVSLFFTRVEQSFIEYNITNKNDDLQLVSREIITTRDNPLYHYIKDHYLPEQFIFYKINYEYFGQANKPIYVEHIGDICWFSSIIISTQHLEELENIVCDISGTNAFTISLKFLKMINCIFKIDNNNTVIRIPKKIIINKSFDHEMIHPFANHEIAHGIPIVCNFAGYIQIKITSLNLTEIPFKLIMDFVLLPFFDRKKRTTMKFNSFCNNNNDNNDNNAIEINISCADLTKQIDTKSFDIQSALLLQRSSLFRNIKITNFLPDIISLIVTEYLCNDNCKNNQITTNDNKNIYNVYNVFSKELVILFPYGVIDTTNIEY